MGWLFPQNKNKIIRRTNIYLYKMLKNKEDNWKQLLILRKTSEENTERKGHADKGKF